MMGKSYPYVMHGRAQIPKRSTAIDPPDSRLPPMPPMRMTLENLCTILRPGATDPRLRPADRWLERWAVTHGTGPLLPYAATVSLVARTVARVPPLDDRESLLVDGVVKSSPQWARTFATLWYRSACTVQQIADEMRIKRRQAVYEERHLVLSYYLGRFAEIGLQVTLARTPR